MNLSPFDILSFKSAIQLAQEAEDDGNLPIGAVITLNGEIIAEGKNAIWYPQYNPNRHAEIEALRSVPEHLWKSSRAMTLYTTLEPCLMCAGAILLHRLGQVMYGSADDYGGASQVFNHGPPYFEEQYSKMEWIGPAYASVCDELLGRVMKLVMDRRKNDP